MRDGGGGTGELLDISRLGISIFSLDMALIPTITRKYFFRYILCNHKHIKGTGRFIFTVFSQCGISKCKVHTLKLSLSSGQSAKKTMFIRTWNNGHQPYQHIARGTD